MIYWTWKPLRIHYGAWLKITYNILWYNGPELEKHSAYSVRVDLILCHTGLKLENIKTNLYSHFRQIL